MSDLLPISEAPHGRLIEVHMRNQCFALARRHDDGRWYHSNGAWIGFDPTHFRGSK